MALWMNDPAEPKTESEQADLDAITALKESAAIELKEQGNQYVKMGKKYYCDAIDCYTRAINQNILSDSDSSILFSNRAHVNLLLGNNRRALTDAEDSIRLCSTNVKAYYRAAKAAFSLGLLLEATSLCRKGLEVLPTNEDMKKLLKQIELKIEDDENHKAQVSKAWGAAKDIVCALESRHLKMGKAMYQELTGVRKPRLENNILHWPVLLLYAEVMSNDFIEFCQVDTFSAHLDMAESGFLLSNGEVLRHMLEGTPGALTEPLEEEEHGDLSHNSRSPSVFYVVSTRSHFYKEFKSLKWTPP